MKTDNPDDYIDRINDMETDLLPVLKKFNFGAILEYLETHCRIHKHDNAADKIAEAFDEFWKQENND